MNMKHLLVFILIIKVFIVNAQTPPTMYFPFNGNTLDESGNGNNATNLGATLTTDRFGNLNSAYSFDGIDDYMEIIPVSDLSAVGDFTVSLWIKFNSWTYPVNPTESISNIEESKYIFNGHARSSTGTNDFYREGMNIIAARDIYDNEFLNTGTVYTYTPSITYYRTINELPNILEWKHIVYKRESGVFTTYINGEIANIVFTNGTLDISNQLDMMHSIFLGTFSGNNPNTQYSGTYNFLGKIDDVSFYNSSITDQEILKLYYKDTYTPLVIIGDIQNQTDINTPNGAIQLTLNGGVKPFLFEWSNGESTQNISSLHAGIYNVKVTDSLGIEYFNSFTVLQNFPADTLSISGFVTANESGVENSLVELYSITGQNVTLISQVYTDPIGNFNFDKLYTNNYILVANPSENLKDNYVTTYYYDSKNKDNAIVILLEGQISHIQIPLLVNTSIKNTDGEYFKIINSIIYLNEINSYTISQINGQILSKGNSNYIDLNNFPLGVYIISFQNKSITVFNKK